MFLPLLIVSILFNSPLVTSNNENLLLTQTVYGFLDFTTTIGNTVMVFSPQSSPKLELKVNNTQINIIDTKPQSNIIKESKDGIKPTKSTVSLALKEIKSEIHESKNLEKQKPINEVQSNTELSTLIKTSENFPEYDLLSRQPEEFAEETYHLHNIRSNFNEEKRKSGHGRKNEHAGHHPVGLVTKISGTHLQNGSPTIHETSVLGTYISGKYAQILQSSSVPNVDKRIKPRPSSSIRVLKTAAPLHHVAKSPKEQSQRRSSNSKANRKSSNESVHTVSVSQPNVTTVSSRKSSRQKGKRRHKNSKSSSTLISATAVDSTSRRPYRTKTPSSTAEFDTTQSQYSFKLNRRPGRWQYKSSPKPKVNIRKHTSNVTMSAQQNELPKQAIVTPQQDTVENVPQDFMNVDRDLEASGSQNGGITNNDDSPVINNYVQTLNVEISTPDNFLDTYYEIATIKSPFIFQAGVVKKTRFITVTSTFEKVLKDEPTETYSDVEGPLTENILESSTKTNQVVLDGSISTLNAIHATDGSETPSLKTTTESFTLSQIKVKTQILPVIYDQFNETKLVTLLQTYDYTSLITITRTISPLNENNFNPSKGFKDFEGNLDEAGSEINLELEFGDEDNAEKLDERINSKSKVNVIPNNKHDPLQPLLNKHSPDAVLPSVIKTTYPTIKLETVWESHVVPLVKGSVTLLRTLSKSIGVVEKTEYITDTSTLALPPAQTPFSINPYFNPLLQLPQQQIITSSEIQQTLLTQTNSKVLKLTFGARTAYTTIFSTEVRPTLITKLVTAALPIQPSAAFPNYFPPPYPPFAYVG